MKGQIIGACTDNAVSFTNAFLDEESKEAQLTLLRIVRVSCACHTVQLALKDLLDDDAYFQDLTEVLKMIAHKLKYMKKRAFEEIGLSKFPSNKYKN